MDINKSLTESFYKEITIRCYAELNDFLPTKRKFKSFELAIKTPVIAAEAIESLGIPLSEVDLILVNSKPAERNQRLYENDYVSVYPIFESFDISSLKTTQRKALRQTRFILDAHLGKLAKYLRMLGFDTKYRNDIGDNEIINVALRENRIILTRDKPLLKSKLLTHGYYVRATEKHAQLREVVQKFDLYSQFKPFTRCMTCNSALEPISHFKVRDKVAPSILRDFNTFYCCKKCDKVFWKGSHFEKMEAFILSLLADQNSKVNSKQ